MKKLILLFILFITLQVVAQHRDAGKIIGYVRDSEGKGLPGVTVYINNTAYSTETDKDGHYILVVSPGSYNVTGSATGYLAHTEFVTMTRGESRRLQFRLRVDPNTTIDQVVVDGKSAIQEVRESPFNVVALDAKSQYNTTLDLGHMLNKASGVRIRETGGVGSDMAISLNGFTGRHVKVFMDGLPMQGFGSAFQLNNIPVTMAERIEVYKGVVPIEFGADALGGVINIVTNQRANTSVDASYSYGSYNTHRANVNLNYTAKSGFSAQVNAVYNYSNNDYPVHARIVDYETGAQSIDLVKVRRFNDQYKNYSLVGRVGFVGKHWADRAYLNLTVGQVDKGIQNANNFFSSFGEVTSHATTFQPSFSYDKRNLIVEGLSVRLSGNYNANNNVTTDTSTYRYNWYGERFQTARRGEFRFSNNNLSQFINRNASGNANIGYQISPKHSISVNDVYTYFVRRPNMDNSEDLTASELIDRVNIKNVLGISHRYNHNRNWNVNTFVKQYLTISKGPRDISESNAEEVYDQQRVTYPAWGYGVATTYFLKDIQLKTSLEKALRLPTDRELFGDELFETGNISLKPETSYNFNLGAVLNKELDASNTIYVDVNAYYRHVIDYIIRTIEDRYGLAYNSNHGKARNIGLDTEVRYYYQNKAMIGGTITWMDLRDKEKYRGANGTALSGTYNKRLPNVPYFYGNMDAAYYFHDLFKKGNTLNVGYTLNFVEEFSQSPEGLGAENKPLIPRQLSHDVILTYIMDGGKYNVTLEGRNITNVLLYDNYALEKMGRNFNVKFRYFFMKRNK